MPLQLSLALGLVTRTLSADGGHRWKALLHWARLQQSTWTDTEKSLAIVTPNIRREPTRSIAKGGGTSVRHLPPRRDKHLFGLCSVEPQIVVGPLTECLDPLVVAELICCC